VANIIPLLHESFKPEQVVLLVTEGMQDKAPHARKMIQSLGIKVHTSNVDSYDIKAIREQVLNVLSKHEGHSLALNVTGGTKIMALGAYEAFSVDPENTVFYLEPTISASCALPPNLPIFLFPSCWMCALPFDPMGSQWKRPEKIALLRHLALRRGWPIGPPITERP
jgi:hypothetical protein